MSTVTQPRPQQPSQLALGLVLSLVVIVSGVALSLLNALGQLR